MNKKGFTLIELLAVIVVIGILSLIAVPNVINIVDNIRKSNMQDDAKKLISLAKMEVNSNYDIRNLKDESICNATNGSGTCRFTFDYLNKNKDIKKDPDGEEYNRDSYVLYKKIRNTETSTYDVSYCIYLDATRRSIGTVDNCVEEKNLYSKNIVTNKSS